MNVNVSDIEEGNNGDYKLEVREFKDGGVEVLLKAIRPMQFANLGDGKGGTVFLSGEEAWQSLPPKFVLADKDDPEAVSEAKKAENHQRSVTRAKQNIRWNVRQMEADRLFTVTYRENMEDREKLKADVKRFLRLVRNGWAGQGGNPDWRYVAVVERQERGAFHVHFAVKGWQKISFLRAAWYKALGGTGKEKGDETPGQVDVTGPKKARWGTKVREWKNASLSAYITKYIAKTFDEESTEKKRYWHSKDLIVPVKERFVLGATDLVSAIKEAMGLLYFNYGVAIDFSRSWLADSKDCLWLSIGGA